jgi:hypothetical protein
MAAQDPVRARPGQFDAVMVGEVPHDRVGSGVEAGGGQLAAQLEDQLDGRWWCRRRAGVRSS